MPLETHPQPTAVSEIEPLTFSYVYTTYYRRAVMFTLSYVADEYVAEDVAADSFVRLWQRMKEEPVDSEHVGPLLLTILRNKALDHLRHVAVQRTAHDDILDWQRQVTDLRIASLEACDPQEIFSEEIRQIVARTLEGLPPQTARAFRLSRLEGMTNQQIADEMGLSVKAVEYHITKALKALRVSLSDYLPLYYFFFAYAFSQL